MAFEFYEGNIGRIADVSNALEYSNGPGAHGTHSGFVHEFDKPENILGGYADYTKEHRDLCASEKRECAKEVEGVFDIKITPRWLGQ